MSLKSSHGTQTFIRKTLVPTPRDRIVWNLYKLLLLPSSPPVADIGRGLGGRCVGARALLSERGGGISSLRNWKWYDIKWPRARASVIPRRCPQGPTHKAPVAERYSCVCRLGSAATIAAGTPLPEISNSGGLAWLCAIRQRCASRVHVAIDWYR